MWNTHLLKMKLRRLPGIGRLPRRFVQVCILIVFISLIVILSFHKDVIPNFPRQVKEALKAPKSALFSPRLNESKKGKQLMGKYYNATTVGFMKHKIKTMNNEVMGELYKRTLEEHAATSSRENEIHDVNINNKFPKPKPWHMTIGQQQLGNILIKYPDNNQIMNQKTINIKNDEVLPSVNDQNIIQNFKNPDFGNQNPAVRNIDSIASQQNFQGLPNFNNWNNNNNNINLNSLNSMNMQPQVFRPPQSLKGEQYMTKLKLVHLDLKGAPPKISYLKQLFPFFKQLGVTGLLIEYEDMFPYWGELSTLSAFNAYSREEVLQILNFAKVMSLDVIPLVQTFGHLEFVLKQEKFLHLRELPHMPLAVCPSNNGSLQLVKLMIDQIMALHPKAKWLHIGADEVFQLGLCPKCQKRMEKTNSNVDMLFLDHVTAVARYAKKKYNVKTIMWDDMFHHMSLNDLLTSRIGDLVEPMIWSYYTYWERHIPSGGDIYGQVFPNIWGATSFKGSTGETKYMTDVNTHLNIHLTWLYALNLYGSKFQNFQGIAVTGWQRYDHFGVLCELLPVAIPSLGVSLLTLMHGGFDDKISEQLSNVLNCDRNMWIDRDAIERDQFMSLLIPCNFPGVKVFRIVHRLSTVQVEIEEFLDKVTSKEAWLTPYNVKYNFSSPYRIEQAMMYFPQMQENIKQIIQEAREALSEIYDDYTVNEWLETNVYPLNEHLEELSKNTNKLLAMKTWPRRPLNFRGKAKKNVKPYGLLTQRQL